MIRKIVAVLIALTLIVAMTACGKGKNPEKNPGTPHGYRVYLSQQDGSGNIIGSRILYQEFDDLVTEKSYIQYERNVDEKKPEYIYKWYYDDDGEVLLKSVKWDETMSELTESCEYDFSGRLIRYSVKQESEYSDGDLTGHPGLPEEYMVIMGILGEEDNWLKYTILYREVKGNVKEIRTEYTYQDDSQRIVSVKSVSENGNVIASLERGDGDIIRSASFDYGTCRYEETFDAQNNKSVWKYYDDSWTNGEDAPLTLRYDGEKEFDETGRCVHYVRYDHDSDGERGLSEEAHFTHDSSGRTATIQFFFGGETVYSESVLQFDSEDRMVKEETFLLEGELRPDEVKTISYHDNGTVAVENVEQWEGNKGRITPYQYREYEEDGTLLNERYYRNGELVLEQKTEYLEKQGIAGTIKQVNQTYYDSNSGEVTSAETALYVKAKLGNEEDWIIYSLSIVRADGTTEEHYRSKFDEKGRLIEAEMQDGALFELEYDDQGRIVREIVTYKNDAYTAVNVFEYEYWEGKKPEAK